MPEVCETGFEIAPSCLTCIFLFLSIEEFDRIFTSNDVPTLKFNITVTSGQEICAGRFLVR